VETGLFNMAADRWLLDQVVADPERGPILRFYGWQQTTLSLGYHQSPIDSSGTLAKLGISSIRRPTGGRAVLHQASADQAELTYSLIVPGLPYRSRRQAYAHLCQILWHGLNRLGIHLDPLEAPAAPERDKMSRSYHHCVSCFATSTAADLTHQQAKIIGSAQLWKQGVVLQHGSLLLQPNLELWEQVLPSSTSKVKGVMDIAPQPLDQKQLIKSLSESAAELLDVTWQQEDWLQHEREKINGMQNQFQVGG
jgi:lipoate-protein ligase A